MVFLLGPQPRIPIHVARTPKSCYRPIRTRA